MMNAGTIGLAVCLCAGGLTGVAVGEESPTTLGVSTGRVVDVAHIYYNISTGERVVTVLGNGQTAGADTGLSSPIWSSLVGNQCVDQGFTTNFFFGLDDNSGTTSLATNAALSDFGDIATNTVVDCVHINWVTDHDDVDADSDGIGDGVAGLGGMWSWWDVDNGRIANCGRTPLIAFTFADLPGDTSPPGDETLAGYTVDIDLVSSFSSSSLSFEVCDTDSDPQSASIFNPGIGNMDNDFDGLPDSDLDGDGLADWSWRVRFYQPGTHDFDSDGVLDGDPADGFKPIGVTFGAPEGTAVDNGDGSWTWDIDTSTPDAGTGQEDAFALYAPDGSHAGLFWFGGFSCDDDGMGGYTPSAMFSHRLYGPGIVVDGCLADLNDDGVLNFFDVSLFLADFAAGGDYNSDGATNFFDVSAFLSDFNEGCTFP